jgi:hypothetical protein
VADIPLQSKTARGIRRRPLSPPVLATRHRSLYPTDLAHNFVLADGRCNNKKRDRLPACDHLAAWVERNAQYGTQLGQELVQRGVVAELTASNRVAQWAYAQTEAASGLTWVQADEMVPLDAGWRGLIGT